jgi:hypothetical protein
MELNELISATSPTLIVGRSVIDTDEVKDVFDPRRKKMVRKRVRGSKKSRVYLKLGSNRKIGGSNPI